MGSVSRVSNESFGSVTLTDYYNIEKSQESISYEPESDLDISFNSESGSEYVPSEQEIRERERIILIIQSQKKFNPPKESILQVHTVLLKEEIYHLMTHSQLTFSHQKESCPLLPKVLRYPPCLFQLVHVSHQIHPNHLGHPNHKDHVMILIWQIKSNTFYSVLRVLQVL